MERAWITQELHLSARTVHFVEDHIDWDRGHKDHDKKSHRFESVEEFHRSLGWLSMVDSYSEREITCNADRFPAIAGIARHWCGDEQNAYEYHCGLFSNELHRGLIWYGNSPDNLRLSGVAPTWYWASLKGRIRFVRFLDRIDSSITTSPCITNIAFQCGCGIVRKDHFICVECRLCLRGIMTTGLEVSVQRSQRFQTAPADATRYVILLLKGYERVGWAMFDDVVD